MYKYTYELSQSYRTETSNNADIYKSCKLYPPTNVYPRNSMPNPSLTKKISHSHSQSKPKPQLSPYRIDVQYLKQTKNLQNIEVKRHEPYRKEKTKEQILQVQQNRKRNVYQPSDIQSKIKKISQKYSHKVQLRPNIEEKRQNIRSIDQKRQKMYTEHAGQPPKFGKEAEKIQKQFNIPAVKPLREVNRTLKTYTFEENEINRTKIKSQIANHLEKSKQNIENIADSSFQKKYDYGINKQPSIPAIPVSDKHQQTKSNETVAKLTSLQQRIKSTVEPFIHF